MTTEKVLLDTDIGSDIDDAVCLAYLLAQPACDLVGVTTVGIEPATRAALADAICRNVSRDIPIYPGTGAPLLSHRYWYDHDPSQAAALGRWPHRDQFPVAKAVDFMIETIRANPGEINLLAIGPMTNVALLFATDPEAAGMLKSLVLMGGHFQENPFRDDAGLECNVMLDPYAAAITYAHRPPVHRTVPLNVTQQVRLPAQEVRERFTAPVLKPVLAYAEVWFERTDQVTFHDPLAAATIFAPDICTFTRCSVDIETASPRVRGMTYFDPDEEGPHEIALAVDPPKYWDHLFKTFEA